MKVLDATVLIAFLREMDFPDGLKALASVHVLLVPQGVVREISKPPTRTRLMSLIRDGVVEQRAAPERRVLELRSRFLSLGRGECECVALWESLDERRVVRLVTDDAQVRKRIPGPEYVWTRQLVAYMVSRRLIDDRSAEGLLLRLDASSFYSPR